ncbi:pyruvate kinase [Solimonas marina]|uniref:Pyruvate kinase n=1 Tax=Solimonas marina TaxID=2714601 RepID=A0A970B5B3_9GAMM|nr:pyruvate kinase [Solimonas marina]NKF23227.1 pyruvate kinase [Solimonas marina]
MRATKIIATLGPATDDDDKLRALIAAGVDVVRLNFSHGAAEQHRQRAERVRRIAHTLERDVAILCDLQGPKIRIESFVDGPIELDVGQRFVIDTQHPTDLGTREIVGCSYAPLPIDVVAGDVLLLDDGAIIIEVEEVRGTAVITHVVSGGTLSARKGLNKLGGGLSAAALTDKDREDLRHAVALDADFIAISFPRTADDMLEARQLLTEAGGTAQLVAKIERAEALDALDSIVSASDLVMVARGDLAVEIGDAALPGWQKRIIETARSLDRGVITATQMMESMIHQRSPTRAEVLDVANAVMDGTDAVMLSAETAVGKDPAHVVDVMSRICAGAEQSLPASSARRRALNRFDRTDTTIAMATAWTATHMEAEAIVALTESGATAATLSRAGTEVPIYALTPYESTRRRMKLCRGVVALAFTPHDPGNPNLAPHREAIELLQSRGYLQPGNRVLVTSGRFAGAGGTNTMKIATVGEERS